MNHTHRKFDDFGRIILETYEDDFVVVTDVYQYDGDWIICEQTREFKDRNTKFKSVERYREDGSGWIQKYFADGVHLTSESRQLDTESGTIWHNIEYYPDGTISRSVHTTTPLPEGVLEQTVEDGTITEYSLIKRNEVVL